MAPSTTLQFLLGFSFTVAGYGAAITASMPNWIEKGQASPIAPVSWSVAMHPSNVDKINSLLVEVSDPNSLQYGQFLTPTELRSLTATSAESVTRVMAHFTDAACTNLGSSLRCKAPVEIAERLLGCQLSVYHHSVEGADAAIIRTSQSSVLELPDAIKNDVVFISGVNQFPELRRRHVAAGRPLDPVTVPETIRKLYNVTTLGSPTIIQAAAEFPGNWHQNTADLKTFGVNVGLKLNLSKIAGNADPGGDPSGETTLDIQYISSVGIENTNWLFNSEDWIFELTQMLLNTTSHPSVISMSYGWSEKKQCGGVTGAQCHGLNNDEYVNRTNFELQKVGLLGITMLASAGDSGCHGRTDKVCFLNAKMYPAYPAASPFVTAVGGTQFDFKTSTIPTANSTTPICIGSGALANQCAMGGSEIVSSTQTGSRITSGGGFSDVASRPLWQDSVVKTYLASPEVTSLRDGLFNKAGRGFPDISALAHNFYIQISGNVGSEDGTSASSPVIGGLIGLLNAHRERRNRPVIGFANPLLYQIYNETNGKAFQDITQGSNRCTESGCECKTGFEAIAGWDASSGLGTPNFGRIVASMDVIDARRERLAQTK